MRLKVMLPIFTSVFMAELGDKTQLATILFVAGSAATAIEVFFASSAALVLSTLIAVIFGAAIKKIISPDLLKMCAGIIFVFVGSLYLFG